MVAVEQKFSAGGNILDEQRSCLTPKSLQIQVCVDDWTKVQYRQQELQQEPTYDFFKDDEPKTGAPEPEQQMYIVQTTDGTKHAIKGKRTMWPLIPLNPPRGYVGNLIVIKIKCKANNFTFIFSFILI